MTKYTLFKCLLLLLICTSYSCKKSANISPEYKKLLGDLHLIVNKINTISYFYHVDTVIFNANQTITEKKMGQATSYPFYFTSTYTFNSIGDTVHKIKLFCKPDFSGPVTFLFRQELSDTLQYSYSNDSSTTFLAKFIPSSVPTITYITLSHK